MSTTNSSNGIQSVSAGRLDAARALELKLGLVTTANDDIDRVDAIRGAQALPQSPKPQSYWRRV